MVDIGTQSITSPSLLSIRNVSNAYISRSYGLFGEKEIKPVLDQVNLEMRTGEILGLTGESGCGKTTLARCVLGLVDYEGEILIEGQRQDRIRHIPPARQVQMVFQDPGDSLNPAKKTGRLVEEPLVIHNIGTPRERTQKLDEILLRVGLDPSYKTRRLGELSGGQKQRICIGRALILEPKLLIADEAISSLDVSVGAQILNLFRDLHENLGLGILFISHNADAVQYLCHRIAVMKNGKIETVNS
jgi:ABC-type dipeptide/oligopeptide/nickel transport system ATPase subunit